MSKKNLTSVNFEIPLKKKLTNIVPVECYPDSLRENTATALMKTWVHVWTVICS